MATLKEKDENIHKQYQMLHTTYHKEQTKNIQQVVVKNYSLIFSTSDYMLLNDIVSYCFYLLLSSNVNLDVAQVRSTM
jgi:L-rhamnose mutarotase